MPSMRRSLDSHRPRSAVYDDYSNSWKLVTNGYIVRVGDPRRIYRCRSKFRSNLSEFKLGIKWALVWRFFYELTIVMDIWRTALV